MSEPLASTRSVVFDEIAQVIGRDSARKLIDALGGARIFVPNSVSEGHELASAIGLEAANRLASFFHGTRIHLPVAGKRRRAVKVLAKQAGVTRKDIALRTGYSERQVYRILDREDGDSGQHDLFGSEGA